MSSDETAAMTRDEYERLTALRQQFEMCIRDAADECGIIGTNHESENALRFIDLAADGVLEIALAAQEVSR